jgi:hypothetical protein
MYWIGIEPMTFTYQVNALPTKLPVLIFMLCDYLLKFLFQNFFLSKLSYILLLKNILSFLYFIRVYNK